MMYADEVNYFKTGTTAPDTWIDNAKKEIARAGGKVLSEACGRERSGGSRYCKKHDMRWRRHGDVSDRPRGRPRKAAS